MNLEEFREKYIVPACEGLIRKLIAGEPLTEFEKSLIRSLGPESASWAIAAPKGS